MPCIKIITIVAIASTETIDIVSLLKNPIVTLATPTDQVFKELIESPVDFAELYRKFILGLVYLRPFFPDCHDFP
jgi:hypothetical protein